MTTVSVYDINAYIKNDPTISNIAGRPIDIFPTIGYENAPAPFIVYYYSPSIPDVEAFWKRADAVLYSVYDTNVVRALDIAERMIDMLAKGDQISQPNGVAGTDFRILSTELTDTALEAPEERDGWHRVNLEFLIHHVKR
jgi:hypothetical protein